jgi:hypothetical protein
MSDIRIAADRAGLPDLLLVSFVKMSKKGKYGN